MQILSIGIKPNTESWKIDRIRITNVLFLFMSALVGVNVVIFSFTDISVLFNISLLGLFVLIVGFVIHYLGFVDVSRLLMAVTPSFITLLTDAAIQSAGMGRSASSLALNLSFLLIPFIIFDTRERTPKYICAGINVSLLFLFPFVNEKIETGITFDDTTINGFIVVFAYSLTFVSSFTIDNLFLNQQKESYKLLQDLEAERNVLNGAQQELNVTLQELQNSKRDEERRNWVSTGVAQFSDLLRKQENLQNIYDAVLPHICRFLNANQAALYIAQTENNLLEMTAKYAYSRKKYQLSHVEFGQGLVGQCFEEKDVLYITDVPTDYIHITSGLGDATPKCLCLLPLMYNEIVEGVLEIATFKPFDEYELDYLKKVCEILAGTVSTVKVSEKTANLLETTQLQAEQMRAQEEEMRQNMEELMATQEEIARKSDELKNFIDAIDSSSVCVVSISENGTILKVNQATLKAFKYTSETELKGSSYTKLCPIGYTETTEYQTVLDPLGQRADFNGEFERIDKNGASMYFMGSFKFERKNSNTISKIWWIAVDITAQKKLLKQLLTKKKI